VAHCGGTPTITQRLLIDRLVRTTVQLDVLDQKLLAAGGWTDRWRRYYSKPDDDVLVVRGATPTFSPTLPQSIIDQAIERDPEAASAEWLAQWRSELADLVSREVVAVVMPGR
jgi:hypothetical protein